MSARALDARAGVGRPFWSLTLYREAGEAGGRLMVPPGAGSGAVYVREPDRPQTEAERRARGKIRRYCAANRLNRFITLTYADSCGDAHRFRKDIGRFFKDLRTSLGEDRMPYLWVPEWHPGGHGLHGHAAVARYIPRTKLVEAWGHGFVHIKLIGDLPVGSGALEEARRCALYLGKYVGKSLDQNRPAGLHRYDAAQGFQPEATRLEGRSMDAVIRKASDVMGMAPSDVWRSDDQEGWDGPPVCSVRWTG